MRTRQNIRRSVDGRPWKGTDLNDKQEFNLGTSVGSDATAVSTMPRILVVDDDPQIRALLRRLLESEGRLVFEAADGIEALAVLEEHPIDLVFIDLLMPRMNGMVLVGHILWKHPEKKMVVMSAHRAAINIAEHELGVVPLLRKPFTLDDVAAKVRDALG